jgi:lysophospholipase L1-like esterase
VRRTSRSARRLLNALTALAAGPGILLSAACAGTPGQPTQLFAAPKAFCPAPVTLASPSGQPSIVSYGSAIVTGGTPPTTVSCSPASGATFPIGVTTVTCTASDHVNRTDVCTFSVAITAPPRLSVTRFLGFGDSITWGEDGRNSATSLGASITVRPMVQFPTPDTYPGALQASLAARYTAQSPTVANGGNPGEAVTGPGTFPRFVTATANSLYDVVLLMEGANDLANNDMAEVIAGLGGMIDYARGRGLRVFLATIPPENPLGCCPFDRGVDAALVAPFNDRVRGLAASKGVPLVDVYQAFGGDLTLIGPDGLHPTADGYHVIANTFFASIRQSLELPAATSASPARVLPSSAPLRRR